jgi:hypothetical protein
MQQGLTPRIAPEHSTLISAAAAASAQRPASSARIAAISREPIFDISRPMFAAIIRADRQWRKIRGSC